MPGMMDDRDLEEVMAAAHADYAIFWAWGAEQGVLTGAKYASIDGSAMEDSRDFTFKPGEGAVGATWESRQPYFAQDAIGMDTKLFWRAKLATYYRIRSIAMAPRADGVLEVGSRKRWEEPPACLQGGGGGAATTAARQASLVPFEATEEALQRVMSTTGAEYAIFWLHFSAVDELKCQMYASIDGALMRKSSTFTFTPGVGAIGRAWVSKSNFAVKDAQGLDIRRFLRQQLTVYHGVHSIAFAVFENGILEYGTRSTWETAPEYRHDAPTPDAPKQPPLEPTAAPPLRQGVGGAAPAAAGDDHDPAAAEAAPE